MLESKLSRYLLGLSIILIPFQALAFSVYNTKIDVSILVVLVWLLLCKTSHLTRTLSIQLVVILFSYLVSTIISFDFVFSRALSSSFFVALVIYCTYAKGSFLNLPSSIIKSWLILTFWLSIISMSLYLLSPDLFNESYYGIFRERSWASLFYSGFSAFFIFSFVRNRTLLNSISLLLSMTATLLFLGSHLITLAIVCLLAAFLGSYGLSPKLSNLLIPRALLISIALVIILAISITFALQTDTLDFPILEKFTSLYQAVSSLSFDTVDIGTSQLSALIWLSGFIQLQEALQACFLLGCGAGSTGIWSDSPFSPVQLGDAGTTLFTLITQNNRYDAYSLMFRSGIEFGILCVPLYIRQIRIYQKSISSVFSSHTLLSESQLIYLVPYAWLIGSLLKEGHFYNATTFFPPTIFIATLRYDLRPKS